MLKVSDFNYHLPPELIADVPLLKRDESKLLIVTQQQFIDTQFKNIINYINPHDLIIFNNTKVFKARLFGNKDHGGKIELLIERILDNNNIIAHIRSNKKIQLNLIIHLPNGLIVKVIQQLHGLFELIIVSEPIQWLDYLDHYGHVPLPPYIKRLDSNLDITNYQTVYAKFIGSVAAPTAGLHFTEHLIQQISAKSSCAYITLHVGSGTFKPVTSTDIHQHTMHEELYCVEPELISKIQQCKNNGGKVIAVGTTTLRTLETLALNNFQQLSGSTNIFITPPFTFKVVDALITNFHLPQSTLLMLVSAFAGTTRIAQAYEYAIQQQYRFFSYGDAMFLTRV